MVYSHLNDLIVGFVRYSETKDISDIVMPRKKIQANRRILESFP